MYLIPLSVYYNVCIFNTQNLYYSNYMSINYHMFSKYSRLYKKIIFFFFWLLTMRLHLLEQI